MITRFPVTSHADSRRTITDVFPFGEILAQVKHLAVIRTGHEIVVLGNHYHPNKVEAFWLASGSGMGAFRDMETGEEEQHVLSYHEVLLVPHNHVHAFRLWPNSVLVNMAVGAPHDYDPTDASGNIRYELLT